MIVNEEAKKQSSLIVAIENSARISTEFDVICKHVLMPFIDDLSTRTVGAKPVLPALKKQLYSLVTFAGSSQIYYSGVHVSKIFYTPAEFKSAIAKVQIDKSECENEIDCEFMKGLLKTCKKLFSKFQSVRRTTDVAMNHLLIILDSQIAETSEDDKNLKSQIDEITTAFKSLKDETEVSISFLNISTSATAFFPEFFENISSKSNIKLSDKHSQTAGLVLDGIQIPIAVTLKKSLPASESVSTDEPARKVQIIASNNSSIAARSQSYPQPSVEAPQSAAVPVCQVTVPTQVRPIVVNNPVAPTADNLSAVVNSVAARPNNIPVTHNVAQSGAMTQNQRMVPIETSQVVTSSLNNSIMSSSQPNTIISRVVPNQPNPNQPIQAVSRPMGQVLLSGVLRVKFNNLPSYPHLHQIVKAYNFNLLYDPTSSKSIRPPDLDQWFNEGQLQFLQVNAFRECEEFLRDAFQLACQFFTKPDNERPEPVPDNDPLLLSLKERVFGCVTLNAPQRQGETPRIRKFAMIMSQSQSQYKAHLLFPNRQNEFTDRLKSVVNKWRMNNAANQPQPNQDQKPPGVNNMNMPAHVQQPHQHSQQALMAGSGVHSNPADQPLNQLANLANNPGLQNQMGKPVQVVSMNQAQAQQFNVSGQGASMTGVKLQPNVMGGKMVNAGGNQQIYVSNQHLQQISGQQHQVSGGMQQSNMMVQQSNVQMQQNQATQIRNPNAMSMGLQQQHSQGQQQSQQGMSNFQHGPGPNYMQNQSQPGQHMVASGGQMQVQGQQMYSQGNAAQSQQMVMLHQQQQHMQHKGGPGNPMWSNQPGQQQQMGAVGGNYPLFSRSISEENCLFDPS